ncbi:MAG: arginine--tRNA ligase, partial [Patescibacteria group bacterium]
MNAWQQILSEVLKSVTKVVGVKAIDPALVTIPPDSKFGDIAIPCFSFVKEMKKAPGVIAKEWAEKLSRVKTPLIASVVAVGPYVNITLAAEAVANIVLTEWVLVHEKGREGKGRRVMIEYSQPNTHKEFHVGHLRNATLGAAIVNLYRKSGYNVKAVNYIGDVGAHV